MTSEPKMQDHGGGEQRRRLVGRGVLVALGLLCGMAIAPAAVVAKDKLAEVLISNDASNPVPVTGSVSVSGTVDVAPSSAEPYRCTFDRRMPVDRDTLTFLDCPAVPEGMQLHITEVSTYTYFSFGAPPAGLDAVALASVLVGDGARISLPAAEYHGDTAQSGRQVSVVVPGGSFVTPVVSQNWRAESTSSPHVQMTVAGQLMTVD